MQIFISYSRPDEASARRLHDELKVKGLNPWLDKEKILPGKRWRNEIVKAIKHSDFAAVLFSTASLVRDGFYHREIRTCLDVLQDKASGKVWLLPVRLENCNVPSEIEEYQYVDLFPEWDEGMKRLLQSIGEQIEFKNEVAAQIDSIITQSAKAPQGDEFAFLQVQLARELKNARFVPFKKTSGSHSLWRKPNGELIVIPKTVSRWVANNVLRQAGLPTIF